MSEQTLEAGPPGPANEGLNIPAAIEELLAWRTDIEARLDALAGAQPQRQTSPRG